VSTCSSNNKIKPNMVIAAPSFVWPTTVRENCYQLQDLVQEVGIILFETQACLKYTENDLSLDLASLDLSYHIHLPLDLPWSFGVPIVMEAVKKLVDKTAYLSPRGYVLHPPPQREQFLSFCQIWQDLGLSPKQLFLENIEGNDLYYLWPDLLETECKVCLDLGHILAFSQEHIMSYRHLWDKITMLHIYGDLYGHRHSSLSLLSEQGKSLLNSALTSIQQETVIVLEVFTPKDLQESLDIFSTWISKWISG